MPIRRTLSALVVTLGLILTVASFAVAPPPGGCTPWPSCRDGGGGGGGGDGGTPSYQFTAVLTGTYEDLNLGFQTFTISIQSETDLVGKAVDLVVPQVMVTGLAADYTGPALVRTSPTDKVQMSNVYYDTLATDFGGFLYSQTWEMSSANAFRTGKPFTKLKVDQSTDITNFDLFVAERRPWNGEIGAVDYDLFLNPRDIFGTVTRISSTEWDIVFSVTIQGEVSGSAIFQRYAWSDYANRIVDWQKIVTINPTVTYTGTGTLVQTA